MNTLLKLSLIVIAAFSSNAQASLIESRGAPETIVTGYFYYGIDFKGVYEPRQTKLKGTLKIYPNKTASFTSELADPDEMIKTDKDGTRTAKELRENFVYGNEDLHSQDSSLNHFKASGFEVHLYGQKNWLSFQGIGTHFTNIEIKRTENYEPTRSLSMPPADFTAGKFVRRKDPALPSRERIGQVSQVVPGGYVDVYFGAHNTIRLHHSELEVSESEVNGFKLGDRVILENGYRTFIKALFKDGQIFAGYVENHHHVGLKGETANAGQYRHTAFRRLTDRWNSWTSGWKAEPTCSDAFKP